MLNIILICLAIILAIYLLFGFIMYGVGMAKQKYDDNKKKEYLGLSIDGLEFKTLDDNPKSKIIIFILSLLIGGFYVIFNYDEIDFSLFKFKYGFSIW